jgi:hypothetical protein
MRACHSFCQLYPLHTLLLHATSSNNLLPLLSNYPHLDLLISDLPLLHLVINVVLRLVTLMHEIQSMLAKTIMQGLLTFLV